MTDDELAALREKTEGGNRAEGTDPEQSFEDHLTDALKEAEENRGSKVVTANAPRLWALLKALDEDDGRRATFYENVGEELDNSDGKMNRSAVLKHLVLLALQENDPDLVHSLKQAKNEVESSADLL